MPHAARSVARRSILPPLVASLIGWLAACPAPAPSGSSGAAPREPPPPGTPNAAVAPSPAPTPSPMPAREPSTVAPVPMPAPDAATMPPALAAEGVRPAIRSLWRALEGVDAGDPDALTEVMVEGGRWQPPGRPEESVAGAVGLRRAMSPWSGPGLAIDVRRIIELGDGPFAAQVSLASAEVPGTRYELVLVVEPRGDRIAAVHHYGDPLGPVRARPVEAEPLDLGPVGDVVLEAGAPQPALADATRALTEAIDGGNDEAARALLTDDVVLHDVAARRTRRGRDAYVAGMRQTLGETGDLAIDRQHVGAGWVVVEGAVLGRVTKPASPDAPPADLQEHGFADVHRVVDGRIAETWHYVNRRGRRLRLRP